MIDAAEEHLGTERAGRYLRKFYPWYLARIGLSSREAAGFQQLDDLDAVRERVRGLRTALQRRPAAARSALQGHEAGLRGRSGALL